MTGHLGATDAARIERTGITPMSTEQGLALFDQAILQPEAQLAAAHLNLPALRRQPHTNPAFGMLAPARPAAISSHNLAGQLHAVPPEQRRHRLQTLVTDTIATVLGHSTRTGVNPQQPLKDLGLDSLTAVELRNRLNAATGLQLPATLAFDHPTPTAITDLLFEEFSQTRPADLTRLLAEFERLAASVPPGDDQSGHRAWLAGQLQSVVSRLLTPVTLTPADAATGDATDETTAKLQQASDEEIFSFIDEQL
jgi:acyl carrier protein